MKLAIFPTRIKLIFLLFIGTSLLIGTGYGIFMAGSKEPSPTYYPASTELKPLITGLMKRNGPPPESSLTRNGQPLIKAFVIQVYWKDIQPNGPDDFDTSSIDSQLSFARAHNLAVRLRLYAGYNSPDWVKQETGSVAWQGTPGDAGPDSYEIPKFWTSMFQSLWATYNEKLSNKYDSDFLIRDVVSGMCGTNFAEPFIKQFSVKENVTTALANGYSDQLNNDCLRESIKQFTTTWPTTRLAVTLNPYQSTSSLTDKLVQPTAIADLCIELLESRCEIGNNSLKSSSRGNDYDALYAMMKSKQVPIYIQTATDKRIGDWRSALDFALSIGATSIELPTGYENWDLSLLQSYNSKLQANA